MISILLKDKNNYVSLYSYVNENGKNYFEDYFDSLPQEQQAKFAALFDHFLAKKGIWFNIEKYRELEDGIFEFKIHGHRALNFNLPNVTPKNVIITHACPKKRNDSLPQKEKKKAKDIKDKVIEAYKNGTLKIIIKER